MWMKLSSFIFIGESKAKDGVQRQKKECQELVESNANQNKAKKEKKKPAKKTERRIKTFGRRRVSKAMELYV